jgi:intracellular protein transport protein USO1
MVYVVDGLLDLTLSLRDTRAFDARLAACECLKAYFHDHMDIRLHFLGRAIEGHKSGADETANVLNVILHPPGSDHINDPYRYWFASIIVFHLLYDNPAAKALAMSLTEGDAENGEEVVTSIQTVAAHLVTGLGNSVDARVLVGYLIVLIGWLFEDLDAVNDFLGEGSNMQSIVQAAIHSVHVGEMVRGLCAMLIGTVYEFSTKDSPIPRPTLQSILTSRMGREIYLDKLSKLRNDPLMRDFEVIPQKLDASSGKLPDIFFDGTFVDFFKDNYSRLVRAIDREPGMEISVVANGVQRGISRELVDSLRRQLKENETTMHDTKTALASLSKQLEQEQANHRRTQETSQTELSQMKSLSTTMQQRYNVELRCVLSLQKLRFTDMTGNRNLQDTLSGKEEEHKRQIEHVHRMADVEADRIQRRTDAEMADLKATISRLEVDLMKVSTFVLLFTLAASVITRI